MFRAVSFVAISAFVLAAGCAAEPAQEDQNTDSSELNLGPSAEQVQATLEEVGLFTDATGNLSVTFRDDAHLSNELRHKYDFQTVTPATPTTAASTAHDKGVVTINWIAEPSWQHPLAGYWSVDLKSNSASPDAPAKHRLKYVPARGDQPLRLEEGTANVFTHPTPAAG